MWSCHSGGTPAWSMMKRVPSCWPLSVKRTTEYMPASHSDGCVAPNRHACTMRGHAGGRGELLAVGQHLVDGLGGGGDDRFLVNEHGVSLCSAGRMPALS